MPTYKIAVDDERDTVLRDIARRDHRPVLWQIEKFVADAIDRARAELATEPAPADPQPVGAGA
jgi:predicted transcriptional regulator